MKHTIITALAAIAMIFGMTSCLPEGPIRSDYTSMADWKNGILYTDDGIELTIVENKSGYNIAATIERVFIHCDILTQKSENAYDVRLLKWDTVSKKNLLRLSDEADRYMDENGNIASDPINLATGWFSKGMLNMSLDYIEKQEKPGTHEFDIIFDDKKSVGDTLYMRLVHNAHGEYYGNPEYKEENLTITSKFASVDIHDLMPSGKDNVIVKVEWKWHQIQNGAIKKETQDYSINGTFKKENL